MKLPLSKSSEGNTKKSFQFKKIMTKTGEWIRTHKIATFVLVLCLVLLAFTGGSMMKRRQMAGRMAQQSAVSTTELKKQSLRKTIGVNGSIESESSRSIAANVNNVEISEVLVQTGDEVKAGDVLCVLDSSTLEKSKELTEQNLSISEAKASINTAAAQRNLEDAIETRDIQNQRNEEKIQSAEKDYDKAVAEDNTAYESYENALVKVEESEQAMEEALKEQSATETAMRNAKTSYQTELSRLKTNTATGGYFSVSGYGDVSSDNLAESITDADAASIGADKEAVDAGLASLRSIQRQYQEAASSLEQAKISYENASRESETWKAEASAAYEQHKQKESAVESAAAAYDQAVDNKEDADRSSQQTIEAKQDALRSAQLDQSAAGSNDKVSLETYVAEIEDCTVIAPFDGVITSVSVEAGDMYNGSEICVLQDNCSLKVSLSVDEYDIADISKGLKALVKTEATDDLEMNGTVTFVAPLPSGTASGSTDSSGVSYEVEIAIEDPSDRLRLGMTAKTSIILEEAEDVFAVPYECVETGKDGKSYITVMEGEESRRITVETGLENDYYIEVASGELQEGMQVVVPDSSSAENSGEQMPGGMMGGGMMGGGAPMNGGRGER